MGGRIGYSAMTGDHRPGADLVRHHRGDLALIPVVAILPILLYIGMLIGSQAFQEFAAPPCAGDRAGAAAAACRLGQDADRQRTGRRRNDRRRGRHRQAGVGRRAVRRTGDTGRRRDAGRHHPGRRSPCSSSTARSRRPRPSPLAGTVLTFFGFIHGAEGIGINSSPTVSVSYLGVAGILFFCARYAQFHPLPVEVHGATAEAD